jgi:TolB-like protein
LVVEAQDRGDAGTAAQWAERWAALCPLNERAHERLLETLKLAGRLDEALARHAAFVSRLEREIGASPSVRLAQLGEELARSEAEPRARASPGSVAVFTSDLVGRAAPFEELTATWRVVTGGSAKVALVEGEEGIGKTRLCEEFLRAMGERAERALQLRGRARESERDVAWSSARELLGGLKDAPGLGGAPAGALAALGRLVPGVWDRFPVRDQPTNEWPLEQAVAQALTDVAAELPVVLYLDDLSTADVATQQLVAFLARHLERGRVLVLCTVRPDDIEPGGPLHDLRSAYGVQHIHLRPLDAAEVERALASMLEIVPAERHDLATRVHVESGGNPFYVTQIVAALLEEGHLTLGPSGEWRLASALAGRPLPLPASVREAVLRRVARLSQAAHRLAQAAAVLDGPSDATLLRAVAGLPPADFDMALEELVARRLIRAPPQPPGTFEFVHALARRTVYSLTPTGRREQLHEAALRVLRSRAPRGRARRSALSYHRARAGSLTSRTVRWVRSRRVGLAVLALFGVTAVAELTRWRAHAAAAGSKRLAVLPFENLGRPEDDYFADGITDEVRGKLATLPGLSVIARTSSAQYKRTTKPAGQISQELGVQYLLTATVRWETSPDGTRRVRVSPELMDAAPGRSPTTKWQQPFDAALSDVFQVQTDIASRVAQALEVALGAGGEQQLAERPTQNLAAYDAFLRAEAAAQSMTAFSDWRNIRQALPYYERAVALDPTFVQAWAQLARAQAYLYLAAGRPTPAGAEAARLAAERAVALGPKRPDGHLALGTYYGEVLVDIPRALAEDSTALALAPGSVRALGDLAWSEMRRGRWEAARAHLEQVQRLDPRDVGAARVLGIVLTHTRHYSEASQAVEQGLAFAPADLQLLQLKAMVALAQGDLAGARAVLSGGPRDVDTALVVYVATIVGFAWALDDAQQALLLRLRPSAFDGDRGLWGLTLAETYARRGDSAHARIYADSARLTLEKQLRAAPEFPGLAQLHSGLGSALTYLGRKAEAVREGERAVAIVPITRDALTGAYNQSYLADIYLRVGEKAKALDLLEPLLRVPFIYSPGWLRVDPSFAPLRGNPRFERLLTAH